MIVTLTTDFGTADGFVGAMKGVILSIAPDAQVVDLTHEIPPQDILAGALALETACRFFPKGTIHIAVVDPGVGSARAAIGIQTENHLFVGPDNGIFELAVQADKRRSPDAVLVDGRTVRLNDPKFHLGRASATFHGRDIFAPAAAWLANGNLLESMGESVSIRTRLPITVPKFTREAIDAHVLRPDRFGNLVSDLTGEKFQDWNPLGQPVAIEIAGRDVGGMVRTFTDAAPGQLLAYFGSGGRLEIAVNQGNAAQLFAWNVKSPLPIRITLMQ